MIIYLMTVVNMCQRFLTHANTVIDHLKDCISVFHESLYNKKSFAFFVLQSVIDRILDDRLKDKLDQRNMQN